MLIWGQIENFGDLSWLWDSMLLWENEVGMENLGLVWGVWFNIGIWGSFKLG